MGYHGGVGPIPSPVQGVKGFRVAIATVWVMAVAGIQSLAQELSYDMSMAIKKKKGKGEWKWSKANWLLTAVPMI